MKIKFALVAVAILTLTSGCVIVSQNRTFPTVRWYWSKDAKAQRDSERDERNSLNYIKSQPNNSPSN